MFDDEGMNKLEKHMIYWCVFALLTAGVVDMFDIDLSENYWSLYLQQHIPAINKIRTSSRYPEYALTLWTVFWTAGPVYIISLVLFFKERLIEQKTFKLIIALVLMMSVAVIQLYFGITDTLPDEGSGAMTQFLYLTVIGNLLDASLGWVVIMSSLIPFINLFKK